MYVRMMLVFDLFDSDDSFDSYKIPQLGQTSAGPRALLL